MKEIIIEEKLLCGVYAQEVHGELIRCKDCIHRGKSEKCVLAAISEEKDFPLFMLDNRGEWFCADGEAKE